MVPPGSQGRGRFLGGGTMLIHEPKSDPNRSKEVKVKIPVGYHVKLHSMKVLTGKAISDAVTEALDLYFATHQPDFAPHAGAPASDVGVL